MPKSKVEDGVDRKDLYFNKKGKLRFRYFLSREELLTSFPHAPKCNRASVLEDVVKEIAKSGTRGEWLHESYIYYEQQTFLRCEECSVEKRYIG